MEKEILEALKSIRLLLFIIQFAVIYIAVHLTLRMFLKGE